MKLGAFSVSLAVKDLAISRAFYEKLGFESFHGDETQGFLILKQGSTVIGLFQGMFEGNILTFNPGWDQNAQPLDSFTDIREIQAKLHSDGIELMSEVEAGSTGPGSFMVKDPDGNTVLLDQHV